MITEAYSSVINNVHCGDAAQVLSTMPDEFVDLVVTSPPYDSIRDYHGFDIDLHRVGEELYRTLVPGGIVVMVMQDQTKNFGKSLTTFRTTIDWCDNIGFKLFECLIYRKHGPEGAWWKRRFRVDHEYMLIFLKGERPRHFDKESVKIPTKHGGKVMTGSSARKTDGTTTGTVTRPINPTKCPGTIWDIISEKSATEEFDGLLEEIGDCPGTVRDYLMAGDKNPLKRKHPAVFPDKIPLDMISIFTERGDIVLDPFVGSGSTIVSAAKLGRKYIGIDISQEYCALSQERLQNEVGVSLFEGELKI